jgi:hypothetical protein
MDNERNEQKRVPSRLYTTEIIDSLRKDIADGFEVDMRPFYDGDFELRNERVTFRMTPEEEEEYEKCFLDAMYFISKYCKFMTDKGRQVVKLRDYQEDIIKLVTDQHYDEELDEMLPDNQNICILAARQVGKTTTTAAYITWYVCFHTDRNVGIIANKEDTAKEIVDKVQEVLRGIPYFLSPGVRSWGKTGCAFDNGCKIISSATTKSASIGFTMNGILYLDEFAHIEPNIAPDFWRSVYPTLSSSRTAQCIITSTPNGLENKFADIWFDERNSFRKLRVDYWQVPGHDDEWAEQMKKDFGEEFFNQEFRLQFSSSSAALIGGNDMAFMEKTLRPYTMKNLIGSNQYLQDEHIKWEEDFDPNYIKEEDKFVMLIDTADGNGDESVLAKQNKKSPDSNTICIFKIVPNSVANIKRFRTESNISIKDAFRYIQVGKYSRNDQDEEYCGNVAAAIALDILHALEFDNVRIMLEMNFQGKNCLNAIMNHSKYFDDLILKTFHKKPIPGEEKEKNKKPGFVATVSKESYCLKGRDMIRKKRIIVTEQESFEQLRAFGWSKGKLKGISMHDDLSLPILNHIPRMHDESTYTEWLETVLYNMPDEKKKFEIDNVLKMFAMEDPNGLTSDDFDRMYGNDNGIQGGGIAMMGGIPTGADFGNPGGILPFGGFGELGQISMSDSSPW